MSDSNGFWRLSHDDLAALLSRTDLSWETARVFLAVADLTLGYGKPRDTISLGQIAKVSGVHRRHLTRALDRLKAIGLYGQRELGPQETERWVVWPASPGDSNEATGTQVGTSADAGTRTSTNAGTERGTRTGTNVGTHQERRIPRKKRKASDVKKNRDLGREKYTDFDDAWKLYPGTKRGSATEFADFKKKHQDWHEVLPLLVPAIESQIQRRADQEQSGAWVPNWKHFKTWLNQRCWETEESAPQSTEDSLQTHDATEEDIVKLQALGVFDD